jgi:hypothetical protein
LTNIEADRTTFTQITAAIPETAAMFLSSGIPIVLAHNPAHTLYDAAGMMAKFCEKEEEEAHNPGSERLTERRQRLELRP